MTTTPDVELQAVFRPAVIAMWATRRVVVVLPLVPVIETTGTEAATHRRRSAGLLGADPLRGRSSDHPVHGLRRARLVAEQGGEDRAERLAGEAAPVAVAPRDGDDDLVDGARRSGSAR